MTSISSVCNLHQGTSKVVEIPKPSDEDMNKTLRDVQSVRRFEGQRGSQMARYHLTVTYIHQFPSLISKIAEKGRRSKQPSNYIISRVPQVLN